MINLQFQMVGFSQRYWAQLQFIRLYRFRLYLEKMISSTTGIITEWHFTLWIMQVIRQAICIFSLWPWNWWATAEAMICYLMWPRLSKLIFHFADWSPSWTILRWHTSSSYQVLTDPNTHYSFTVLVQSKSKLRKHFMYAQAIALK